MAIKVSVIVPIYNVQEYIDECLQSIINQTYGNLEVICIDDGSSDMSGDIVDKYAQEDRRIKVIHKKNEGLAAARNTALDIATGDIVSFVDSDDWLDADTYKLVVTEFENNHDLDMVEFGYIAYYSKGKQIPYICNGKYSASSAKISLINQMGITGYVCTKCIRRSFFDTIRFPIGYLYEDNIVSLELFQSVSSFVYIYNPLYYYRQQRPGAITYDILSPKVLDIIKTLDNGFENQEDQQKKQDIAVFIISNIRSRMYTAIFRHGIKGGKYIHRLFNPYIIKYKSVLSSLSFYNKRITLENNILLRYPSISVYLLSLASYIKKKIKQLKNQ